MALEIPDAVHACGAFVGVTPVPAPFASVPPLPTDNQVCSNGVASFTRLGVGRYQVELEQPINVAEAIVQPSGPLNFTGTIQGQVSADGLSVLVNAYDANQNPVDLLLFDLLVIKVPSGKSLVVNPAAAPQAGGLGLPFSAALTGAPAYPANRLEPGVINTIDNSGGAVTVYLPTVADGAVEGARRVMKDIGFGANAITVDGSGSTLEDPTTAPATAPAAGPIVIAAAQAAGIYLVWEFHAGAWYCIGRAN
jgi:hypothetical protein